jgi:hypothetical protein
VIEKAIEWAPLLVGDLALWAVLVVVALAVVTLQNTQRVHQYRLERLEADARRCCRDVIGPFGEYLGRCRRADYHHPSDCKLHPELDEGEPE